MHTRREADRMYRMDRKPTGILGFLYAALLISSCSMGRLDQNFDRGRLALMAGHPEEAVAYFSEKADSDPNYRTSFVLTQSIWTYLGRAYYETAQYGEARSALEKALASDNDDYMARLYHGMTLVRSNERERGSTETETALRELYQWLDNVALNPATNEWDSNKQIRKAIETGLAGKPAAIELVVTGQRVGKQLEEEIDRTRREKVRAVLRN